MITAADLKNWMPADLKPYIDTVLDLFGENRVMFGSDWPVYAVGCPRASENDFGPMPYWTARAAFVGLVNLELYGCQDGSGVSTRVRSLRRPHCNSQRLCMWSRTLPTTPMAACRISIKSNPIDSHWIPMSIDSHNNDTSLPIEIPTGTFAARA